MKLGTLKVQAAKFRLPCVYEYIDAKGERLYAGYSRTGMRRAFTPGISREQPGRYASFFEVETIRVTVYDDAREAAQEESRLIALYKPRYNRAPGVTLT